MDGFWKVVKGETPNKKETPLEWIFFSFNLRAGY